MGSRALAIVLVLAFSSLAAGCLSGPKVPEIPTSFNCDPPGPGEALLNTTKGCVTFRLLDLAAPKTIAHFRDLANRTFYDGIPFHRYQANFVIQGGDPLCKDDAWRAEPGTTPCGTGGSGQTVPLEGRAQHTYGAVGLAHGSNTTTDGDSQFYIVVNRGGEKQLDGNYTVFGQVTTGMDVALKLRPGDIMTHVTVG